MSVGDNLLDHFTKKNIDNDVNLNKDFQTKNKNYKFVEFFAKDFKNKIKLFDSVAINLNKDNYIIEEIVASYYNKDLTECKKKYMELYNDVNLLLKDLLKLDRFEKEFNELSTIITVWDYDTDKKDWEKLIANPKMFEKTNYENSIQLGLVHFKHPGKIKASPSAYCQTGFQLIRKHIR